MNRAGDVKCEFTPLLLINILWPAMMGCHSAAEALPLWKVWPSPPQDKILLKPLPCFSEIVRKSMLLHLRINNTENISLGLPPRDFWRHSLTLKAAASLIIAKFGSFDRGATCSSTARSPTRLSAATVQRLHWCIPRPRVPSLLISDVHPDQAHYTWQRCHFIHRKLSVRAMQNCRGAKIVPQSFPRLSTKGAQNKLDACCILGDYEGRHFWHYVVLMQLKFLPHVSFARQDNVPSSQCKKEVLPIPQTSLLYLRAQTRGSSKPAKFEHFFFQIHIYLWWRRQMLLPRS